MAEQGDMQAHEQTYAGFISWAKWGAIVSVLTTLIIILIIS